MKLDALYLVSGRGWVAAVTLDDKEVYKIGDQISIGNICWTIRGIELSRNLFDGKPSNDVGLLLRAEYIETIPCGRINTKQPESSVC